ncbi:MAG: GNAT family N-acetyltransferase [Deltaproteobacteria bacterium]|nr:GNAT family N-acetyltransferase [Deltaproteobacteria bacterium]
MDHYRRLGQVLKDYPKEVILKDGTGVTLRPLKEEDEEALIDMFKGFSEDELWFLNHDLSDSEIIHGWVEHLDVSRVISIVAILEGRIIANAVLMMKKFGAKSHIGKLRISVAPAFREKRLGTWMLLDLGNLAMAIGLQVLVMRLVPDRDASAIKGVKKLGFVEDALLKDYVLDREGKPYDIVMMTKRLAVKWDDF